MKRTSLHMKNMSKSSSVINCKIRDFAIALRAQDVSGAFEKWAPGEFA